MTATTTNLDHALLLARLGYRVGPLCWPTATGACGCGWNHDDKVAGKAPRLKDGVKGFTADPGSIHQYWQEAPKANVGMALDRLIMLDPDSDAAQEEAQDLGLPPTLTRLSRQDAYIYKGDPRYRQAA